MSEVAETGGSEQFFGGYSGRMLVVTALAWGTLQTARFLLPPLLPEVQADLDLTIAQAGIILTALQGVYGVSQYPGGRLSDSWSRSTLIVPAMGVLALGSLLIGTATGFLFLLLGTVVFGAGKGLFAIPSRALISDLFVEHRGRALGLFDASSDVGGALAAVLAIVVLTYASWRIAFVPLAVVLFALTVLFALWTGESYVVGDAELEVLSTIRRLLATPDQRWTLVAYTLFYVMMNGVLNFLPTYLRDIKGFSPALASGGFALLFVVGMGVKPMAGAVSDRIPRHYISVVGMLLGAVTLAGMLVVESVVAVVAAIVLFSMSYKGQLPIIDALLIDAAPADKVGRDLGAARTLFLGVGSLGPAIVGVVAEAFDYTVAFACLVGCLLLAGAILAWQARG